MSDENLMQELQNLREENAFLRKLLDDRERLIEATRRREELFHSLFENSREGMLVADDKGKFLFVNPYACELLCYPRERLLRMHIADLVVKQPRNAPKIGEKYGSRGREMGEFVFVRADGEKCTAQYFMNRLASGLYVYILRDVTATRQIEQMIREKKQQERRWEALLQMLDNIVIFECNKEGIYLQIWTANEQLLPRPKHELVGNSLATGISQENLRLFQEAFSRVATTKRPEEIEYTMEVPMGRHYFSAHIDCIGREHNFFILVRDITATATKYNNILQDNSLQEV